MSDRWFVRPLVGAVLALSFVRPTSALGWGDEGHRIVARIAYQRLDPDTRNALDALLEPSCAAGSPIECAAVWPDLIKDERKETRPLHYVDVPLGETASAGPGCKCIVSAIAAAQKTLGDPEASLGERREAAKFLVHFVGDLHQPLHATTAQKIDPKTQQRVVKNGKPVYDRGGNDFLVTFYDETTIPIYDKQGRLLPMELHWVWDSSLLERKLGTKHASDGELAAYAASLAGTISEDDARAWQDGDVAAWVDETHAVGESHAYRDASGAPLAFRAVLGDPYYERNAPVVDRQLQKAGVRLASNLTRALSATKPDSDSAPDVVVYANRNGVAYHREGCRYWSPTSVATTPAEAKSKGLHACGTCRPPQAD